MEILAALVIGAIVIGLFNKIGLAIETVLHLAVGKQPVCPGCDTQYHRIQLVGGWSDMKRCRRCGTYVDDPEVAWTAEDRRRWMEQRGYDRPSSGR